FDLIQYRYIREISHSPGCRGHYVHQSYISREQGVGTFASTLASSSYKKSLKRITFDTGATG
ncbi:hypothetical protein BgiBS90_018775, partial [Biomphalaria glabrata]